MSSCVLQIFSVVILLLSVGTLASFDPEFVEESDDSAVNVPSSSIDTDSPTLTEVEIRDISFTSEEPRAETYSEEDEVYHPKLSVVDVILRKRRNIECDGVHAKDESPILVTYGVPPPDDESPVPEDAASVTDDESPAETDPSPDDAGEEEAPVAESPAEEETPPAEEEAPPAEEEAPPAEEEAPPAEEESPPAEDEAPPPEEEAPPVEEEAPPPDAGDAPPAGEYLPPPREYLPPAVQDEAPEAPSETEVSVEEVKLVSFEEVSGGENVEGEPRSLDIPENDSLPPPAEGADCPDANANGNQETEDNSDTPEIP